MSRQNSLFRPRPLNQGLTSTSPPHILPPRKQTSCCIVFTLIVAVLFPLDPFPTWIDFMNKPVGTGMALRDSVGSSIFVACRYLFGCADAVDAELAATEEGLALALHWSPLPLTLETDSSEEVTLVNPSTPNTSRYSSRVQVIRELIEERNVSIININREVNSVRHGLAKLGREQVKTAVPGNWRCHEL